MTPDDPDYWKNIIITATKRDPAFWMKESEITFLFKTINLMALHGFLCLALRHPGTKDHSCRPAIEGLVKQIGKVLVDLGALSPEQLAEIQKTEQEATS